MGCDDTTTKVKNAWDSVQQNVIERKNSTKHSAVYTVSIYTTDLRPNYSLKSEQDKIEVEIYRRIIFNFVGFNWLN